MLGLDSLNELVKEDPKPTDLEFIYYLFWEKGISLKEFNELPLPYIFSMVKSHTWVKAEEAKAYKKANKR